MHSLEPLWVLWVLWALRVLNIGGHLTGSVERPRTSIHLYTVPRGGWPELGTFSIVPRKETPSPQGSIHISGNSDIYPLVGVQSPTWSTCFSNSGGRSWRTSSTVPFDAVAPVLALVFLAMDAFDTTQSQDVHKELKRMHLRCPAWEGAGAEELRHCALTTGVPYLQETRPQRTLPTLMPGALGGS